jgi:hypothetical protein
MEIAEQYKALAQEQRRITQEQINLAERNAEAARTAERAKVMLTRKK